MDSLDDLPDINEVDLALVPRADGLPLLLPLPRLHLSGKQVTDGRWDLLGEGALPGSLELAPQVTPFHGLPWSAFCHDSLPSIPDDSLASLSPFKGQMRPNDQPSPTSRGVHIQQEGLDLKALEATQYKPSALALTWPAANERARASSLASIETAPPVVCGPVEVQNNNRACPYPLPSLPQLSTPPSKSTHSVNQACCRGLEDQVCSICYESKGLDASYVEDEKYVQENNVDAVKGSRSNNGITSWDKHDTNLMRSPLFTQHTSMRLLYFKCAPDKLYVGEDISDGKDYSKFKANNRNVPSRPYQSCLLKHQRLLSVIEKAVHADFKQFIPTYVVRGEPYGGGPRLGQITGNWFLRLAQSEIEGLTSQIQSSPNLPGFLEIPDVHRCENHVVPCHSSPVCGQEFAQAHTYVSRPIPPASEIVHALAQFFKRDAADIRTELLMQLLGGPSVSSSLSYEGGMPSSAQSVSGHRSHRGSASSVTGVRNPCDERLLYTSGQNMSKQNAQDALRCCTLTPGNDISLPRVPNRAIKSFQQNPDDWEANIVDAVAIIQPSYSRKSVRDAIPFASSLVHEAFNFSRAHKQVSPSVPEPSEGVEADGRDGPIQHSAPAISVDVSSGSQPLHSHRSGCHAMPAPGEVHPAAPPTHHRHSLPDTSLQQHALRAMASNELPGRHPCSSLLFKGQEQGSRALESYSPPPHISLLPVATCNGHVSGLAASGQQRQRVAQPHEPTQPGIQSSNNAGTSALADEKSDNCKDRIATTLQNQCNSPFLKHQQTPRSHMEGPLEGSWDAYPSTAQQRVRQAHKVHDPTLNCPGNPDDQPCATDHGVLPTLAMYEELLPDVAEAFKQRMQRDSDDFQQFLLGLVRSPSPNSTMQHQVDPAMEHHALEQVLQASLGPLPCFAMPVSGTAGQSGEHMIAREHGQPLLPSLLQKQELNKAARVATASQGEKMKVSSAEEINAKEGLALCCDVADGVCSGCSTERCDRNAAAPCWEALLQKCLEQQLGHAPYNPLMAAALERSWDMTVAKDTHSSKANGKQGQLCNKLYTDFGDHEQSPAATGCEQTLSRNMLQSVYHLPINEAAAQMSIGVTVLKRFCRQHNVGRWPYRKLQSVDKLIRNVEEQANYDPDGAEFLIRELGFFKQEVYKNPAVKLDDSIKKLRQANFKLQYKQRLHAGKRGLAGAGGGSKEVLEDINEVVGKGPSIRGRGDGPFFRQLEQS